MGDYILPTPLFEILITKELFFVTRVCRDIPAEWSADESWKRMVQFSEGCYLITQEENQFYFNDLRSGTYSFDEGSYDFVFKYKMIENDREELPFSKMDTTPMILGL